MMTCAYTFIQSDQRNIAIPIGVANSIIGGVGNIRILPPPPPPAIIEFATPLAIAHVSKLFLNFHFHKIFHYFIICDIFLLFISTHLIYISSEIAV
jgi:hypothetical protein